MSYSDPTISLVTADTVVACCTPTGGTGGSLAILRLSGPEAFIIVDRVARLSNKRRCSELASHTIHHGYLVDVAAGVHIDEVMFSLMHAPRTFTGEHTVEISCHYNPLIIEQCIQLLIAAGARLAQRGEFTRRAFLNNKIDLIQAEAIHELITASTQQAVQAALAQVSGSMSQELKSLEKKLIATMAWCEASFEFVEEVGKFGSAIKDQLTEIMRQVRGLIDTYAISTQMRSGIRIVLLGTPNAGKSSLFNKLLGRTRAIVTPIPGTTRDTIEAHTARNGKLWMLIDTAGVRDTVDIIEQAGIERTWQEAMQADIILLVIDTTREHTAAENVAYEKLIQSSAEKIIVVYNKIDQPAAPHVFTHRAISSALYVSAIEEIGIAQLEECILQRMATLYQSGRMPFLINERQYRIIVTLEQQLQRLLQSFSENAEPHYELISIQLQQAIETVSELTGKSVSNAALDAVFREFCIGK